MMRGVTAGGIPGDQGAAGGAPLPCAAMSLSAPQLRTWRTFLETHALVMRRLAEEMETEEGLPLAWFDALVHLHEAGGSLRMHELAARLVLTRSATTRFADRLEEAGLVERASCPTDRRGTVLRLTADGARRLQQAIPVHLRGVEEHFARHLSEDHGRRLEETLGSILSAERTCG